MAKRPPKSVKGITKRGMTARAASSLLNREEMNEPIELPTKPIKNSTSQKMKICLKVI